ncbi:phospholipase D zeta 1-like isoform X3 [Phragmites australis]|uniref:phospholipase D zeta 1-like isoform X3 n=1 Tax=Phragmites australis TaxID=29695 RepID=UPI002D79A94C|nr:phospholipase D zeta 1-like isoform X3 [Phragmites australis]
MRRGSSTSSRAPPSFPSRAPKWGTSRPCCSPTPSRSTTSRKSCDFGVMLITLKSRPWVESTIKLYVNWVATMFRWRLYKKASQVLYLHFALKRREFLEEFHEKQEQIAVVIEDKEVVNSKMDGRPWEAGKFSLSLRLSLWAEHLGLHPGEISHIMDPIDDSTFKNIWMATAKISHIMDSIDDSTFKNIWMATAKTNTMIYQDVFSCVPNDLMHSRVQFWQSFAQLRDKIGHTTIDLGFAQEKLET